jgi:hypothetical protein
MWIDETAEVGRGRKERKNKDGQKRERVIRKKMQAHEKVEKSQNTVCFQ